MHAGSLERSWAVAPVPPALAGAALVLYAQAFLRLRRRSGAAHADVSRAALFCAGLAVSVLAVVSPVDHIGEEQLLSAHMLQHLLLGDLGPVLVVLGVRGPLVVFLLPPPLLRAAARSPLRGLASFLLRPRVAIVLWLAALGGWHVPPAYDAALAHPLLHDLEHACFALAGTLAWTQILDPARRGRLTVGQRAMFAFTMLVASGLLAEALVALHPLYPHYAAIGERPFGWTAGEDQSRAALLMMGEQIATLATAMTFLVRAHVERVQPELPG
jgi:cytochrome c oxidase assembly factor CtaG